MVLHEDTVLKRVDLDELLGGGPSDLWLMDPEGLLSSPSPDTALAQLDSESFLANMSLSASLKNFEYSLPNLSLMGGLKFEPAPAPAANAVSNVAVSNQFDTSKPLSRPAPAPICDSSSAPKRRKNTITAAAVRVALSRTSTTNADAQQIDSSRSPMSSPGDSLSVPSTPCGSEHEQYSVPPTTVFAGKPMTKDDLLKLENKLEKNRQMAKEARRKKKEYLKTLEDQMAVYQQTIATLQQRLAESERRNASLQTELNLVKASVTGVHTQSDSPLINLATAQVANTLLANLGPALLPFLAQNAPVSATNSGTNSNSDNNNNNSNNIGSNTLSHTHQISAQNAQHSSNANAGLLHHVTSGAQQIPYWATTAGSSLASSSYHHLPVGNLNLQLNVSDLSSASAQKSMPLVSTPRGSISLSTSPV